MKRITWSTAPVRHSLLIINTAIILLFHSFKNNERLMKTIAEKIVKPVRMTLSYATAFVPFSAAEILIALTLALFLWYVVSRIRKIIRLKFRKDGKSRNIGYKLFLTAVTLAVTVYALFCILWGASYYGDDFVGSSGLKKESISVEQLETVTEYFAELANAYSRRVTRNLQGVCEMNRKMILKKSSSVYSGMEKTFPALAGPAVPAKGILCSKAMSLTGFTGFFFPITGEANVNMNAPSFMLPVTAAHELAHCRGVAKEEEANFVAVLACLGTDDPEYIYSAALMAYQYLSDSLQTADYERYSGVSAILRTEVKKDLAADSYYWSGYRTGVRKVTDAVYDGFLKSYDQKLGLKSYGECVDLLVNYYYPLLTGDTNAKLQKFR